MNEQRIRDYLNLIQQLLTCPNGEELGLLQANEELIDVDFIQVMERVASQMQGEGQQDAADFLRNLAGQLRKAFTQAADRVNRDRSNRTEAYIQLIEGLLNCRSGEEASQILNANRDLVDAGLVQTMGQVATMLQERGDQQAADLLINLASQLIEALAMSGNATEMAADTSSATATPEEYHNFLMQVLRAIYESKGDQQVVYPLLQGNLEKLDDNLAQVLQAWATPTLAQVEPEQAQVIAAVIVNFSNLMAQFPLGNRASNLEIAITGYETALEVYTREAFPANWAATKNNLAIVYSDRIRGERAQNLEDAIACYQAALEVYTREAFPYEWAMTQNNLAAAYRNRIRGEKAENLEEAIACYQATLEVYTREAFPQNHANTAFNLGLAYQEKGQF